MVYIIIVLIQCIMDQARNETSHETVDNNLTSAN